MLGIACALAPAPSPAMDGLPGRAPAMDPDAPQSLHLEVQLNGMPLPVPAPFVLDGGRLLAAPAVLQAIGFTGAAAPGDAPVDLATLPGVRTRYDAARQRIEIDAPLSLLALPGTRLNMAADAVVPAEATGGTGALLNYDLHVSHDGDAMQVTAGGEARVFGIGGGVFSSTGIVRAYDSPGDDDAGEPPGWRVEPVRLDTRWVRAFPDSAVQLTVGDALTGFLDWTRPVRIGGIQVGRNYGLQPYRITTPLPAFLGEATVPSEVELFVNGMRQYTGAVPAGPFQLGSIPGVTGAGTAQVVVTDAYGRVRTIAFPFYSTRALLARGLSDWSLAFGVAREDYGLRSDRYGDGVLGSGHLRVGATDRLTLEAQAEHGDGVSTLGGGGRVLMGRAGVAGLAYARARHDDGDGGLVAMSYQWNDARFHVGVDVQRAHGDYRDIATLADSPAPRRSERAIVGATSPFGSVSLTWARLAYAGVSRGGGGSAPPDIPGIDQRYAGLFWTRGFAGGWSAHASFNRDLGLGDDTVSVGLLVPLGPRRQLTAGWQRSGGSAGAWVEAAQPLPGDRGHGWRAQVRGGDLRGGLAESSWAWDRGRASVGAASFGDLTYAYGQGSGSLVWMDGGMFAGQPVADAFALVSTGLPGVPVRLENRPLGRTDADGHLLVTPLQAWQRNRLSIDPLDLPADLAIGDVEQLAVPRDRSGTLVRFDLRKARSAIVVLHGDDGRPLPVGTRVRGPGIDTVVGHDGETWLEPGDAPVSLDAGDGGHRCRATLPAAGGATRIGPLRCAGAVP